MTTNQVIRRDGDVFVRFGRHEVPVPHHWKRCCPS